MLMLMMMLVISINARDGGLCNEGARLGSRCQTTDTALQTDGVCVAQGSEQHCHVPDTRDFKFSLRISIRQLRLQAPATNTRPLDNLWIRGNGPGLSWDKSIQLKKSARGLGLWVVDITYKYDTKGVRCSDSEHCLFNQKALEFRVYQDANGNYDMIGPNLYVDLPIPRSMFGHQSFILPSIDVHPWFGGKSITIEEFTLSDLPAPFAKFKVHLLYPPSFDFNVRRKYPVVILFGSDEGIRISPLLETMFIHEASIHEALFINVQYFDSAPFCAFNPYSKANTGSLNSIWKCKDPEQCKLFNFCWFSRCDKESFYDGALTYLYAKKCGGEGEIMLDIIEKYLVPKVIARVPNRLILDFPRNRLSIIGYDGGGLLACHAAITRPHTYQNAACMSPPFYWPLNVLRTNNTTFRKTGISKAMANASHELFLYPEKRAFYIGQKYYIDYGLQDNHHFPIVDTSHYVDQFIEKLQLEFSISTPNILHFKSIPGSSNNYFLYPNGGMELLNRIKIPLLFFLRAKGGPNADFPHLAASSLSDDHHDEGTELEEVEELDIPEECLLQFQTFQQRYNLKSKYEVPLGVLLMCIGKGIWLISYCMLKLSLNFLQLFT